MLIDCHTHDTTRTDAIISVSPALFRPEEGKHYSVGIHPWETGATPDFELLERAAAHPSVAAIGETGVDLSLIHISFLKESKLCRPQKG